MMNTAGRDLEGDGGFVVPDTVQDAVDLGVRYTPFEHGSTVGAGKLCLRLIKQPAFPCLIVRPEPQVRWRHRVPRESLGTH
jgi:hypothetical protein